MIFVEDDGSTFEVDDALIKKANDYVSKLKTLSGVEDVIWKDIININCCVNSSVDISFRTCDGVRLLINLKEDIVTYYGIRNNGIEINGKSESLDRLNHFAIIEHLFIDFYTEMCDEINDIIYINRNNEKELFTIVSDYINHYENYNVVISSIIFKTLFTATQVIKFKSFIDLNDEIKKILFKIDMSLRNRYGLR